MKGVLGAFAPNKRILGDKIQCLLQHKTTVLCWVWVTIVFKNNLPKRKGRRSSLQATVLLIFVS